MTRFVYLSDSHIGTTPVGFQQQPSTPEHIETLLVALEEWIARHGAIDFIIHGGDMVNEATESNIRRAADVFRLSVPVHLCLGNHDLDTPDALDLWMTHAPGFFVDSRPNFLIEHGDTRIGIMPNQWDDTPYHWQEEQRPHFTPDQFLWLEQEVARAPEANLQLFVTHSPVHGIPAAQTGFREPYHAPDSAFASDIARVTHLNTGIRCVVGGHNHINSCTESGGIHFVTVSSFVEAPFEFKLFEIDQESVHMTTHNLAGSVPFRWSYDFDRTYVQGRACDREFRNTINANPSI